MFNNNKSIFSCRIDMEKIEAPVKKGRWLCDKKAINCLPDSTGGWFQQIRDFTTPSLSNHMGHLGRVLPNIDIKRKIRSLLAAGEFLLELQSVEIEVPSAQAPTRTL